MAKKESNEISDKMITFRSSKEFYRHLIKVSHKISLERDEDLNISDIIREALEKTYPSDSHASLTTNGGIENGAKNGRER